MTSTVGKIRTSTGSIRVIKIIQKNRLRSGKRNQTMANAESIDTTILPTVMANAMMKLLSIISQNGALLTPTPFTQMVFMFSSRWPPGIRVIGVSNTDWLSSVAATKATYSGNKMTAIPRMSMVWLKIVSPRRFSIIGNAPYFQRNGTAPPSE